MRLFRRQLRAALRPVGGPDRPPHSRGRSHDHLTEPGRRSASISSAICRRGPDLQSDRRRDRRHPQCRHRQNSPPRSVAGAARGGAGASLPSTRPAPAAPVPAADAALISAQAPCAADGATRACRSRARSAVRCSNWRRASAAGRSAIPARRILPFAATKLWPASPTAPAMPAWRIGRRRGGALREQRGAAAAAQLGPAAWFACVCVPSCA